MRVLARICVGMAPRADGSIDTSDGVSSSGTRLTNEFRYLLDVINIASRVGWFRAAAILRRVKGVGVKARPVGRPRSGVALTPAPDGASWGWRGRPFGVANAPCSLARSCRIGWTRTMRPSQELDRIGDNTDLDLPAAPTVTDPIVGAGERHVPEESHPRHDHPVGGSAGMSLALPPRLQGLRRWTCSATSTSRWRSAPDDLRRPPPPAPRPARSAPDT